MLSSIQCRWADKHFQQDVDSFSSCQSIYSTFSHAMWFISLMTEIIVMHFNSIIAIPQIIQSSFPPILKWKSINFKCTQDVLAISWQNVILKGVLPIRMIFIAFLKLPKKCENVFFLSILPCFNCRNAFSLDFFLCYRAKWIIYIKQ